MGERRYDYYFMVCLALIIVHIRWSPLRAGDGTIYRRIRTRIYEIGVGVARKRRMTQQVYRERRRSRMEIPFRVTERMGQESLRVGREGEQELSN